MSEKYNPEKCLKQYNLNLKSSVQREGEWGRDLFIHELSNHMVIISFTLTLAVLLSSILNIEVE